MTNSAKDHQGMLKALGEQEIHMEIHRLSINYKVENVPLEWADLVVTSPNLASPRVKQPDHMDLRWDAVGVTRDYMRFLPKCFPRLSPWGKRQSRKWNTLQDNWTTLSKMSVS